MLRIAIANYRGVVRAAVDLEPVGVTVIEGPNGSGKSSLAEALATVLTTPETSKSQSIRAIQPVGQDVASDIEVEVETGEYRFILAKSYNRRATANLTVLAPHPESRVGGEAHDRAIEILDQTGVDRQLMRALWVRQGMEMAQVALRECPSLGRALDMAAGSVPAGEAEQTVLESARQEYLRYWTPGGAEAKRMGDLRRGVESARSDVEAARLKEVELEEQISRSERSLRALTLLREQTGELQVAATLHAQSLQEVEGLAAEVELRRQHFATAAAEAGLAHARQQAREALVRAVVEAETRLQASLSTLVLMEEQEVPQRQRYLEAEEALRLAGVASDEAATRLRVRAADEAVLHQQQELARLRQRMQAVSAAVRRRAAAQAVVGASKVSEGSLELLREQEGKVREGAARLAAAGASVRFTATQTVAIGRGDEVSELFAGQTRSFTIADSVGRFKVGDLVELEVEPGTGAAGERERQRDLVAERDQMLRDLGVKSLQEAALKLGERQRAERHLEEAGLELGSNLAGLSMDELQDLTAAKEAEIQLQTSSRSWREAAPVTAESARELVLNAELEDERAREERDRTERRRDALRDPHQQARLSVQAARAAVNHDREESERSGVALEQARFLETDDSLAARAAESSDAAKSAEVQCSNLAHRLEALEPRVVRDLAENSAKAMRRLQEDIHTEEGAGMRADAQVEALAPVGLFDMRESRTRELERKASDFEREERLAVAARTLLESLERARSEAQRSYLEPLRQQIEARGMVVFGSEFEVRLDAESLQVATCRIDNSWLEWDKLSTGTQEQLAIIVRLSAAFLAAPGGGVPLIIDDALGYADEERLERMCVVLGRAGPDVQVIVLTCMPRRYQQIGGARTVGLSKTAHQAPASG
ncbi:MAG: ATP-binding protein [Candidatus Dormibacteria bacterium]